MSFSSCIFGLKFMKFEAKRLIFNPSVAAVVVKGVSLE